MAWLGTAPSSGLQWMTAPPLLPGATQLHKCFSFLRRYVHNTGSRRDSEVPVKAGKKKKILQIESKWKSYFGPAGSLNSLPLLPLSCDFFILYFLAFKYLNKKEKRLKAHALKNIIERCIMDCVSGQRFLVSGFTGKKSFLGHIRFWLQYHEWPLGKKIAAQPH